MKKHWAFNYLLSAQWRFWSDWVDAQVDLSLRWVHIILLVLSCSGSFRDNFPVYLHENLGTEQNPLNRAILMDTLNVDFYGVEFLV